MVCSRRGCTTSEPEPMRVGQGSPITRGCFDEHTLASPLPVLVILPRRPVFQLRTQVDNALRQDSLINPGTRLSGTVSVLSTHDRDEIADCTSGKESLNVSTDARSRGSCWPQAYRRCLFTVRTKLLRSSHVPNASVCQPSSVNCPGAFACTRSS